YLAEGNFGGVEFDLDRLRMTGGSGTHHLILRAGPVAAGITRHDVSHASHVFKNSLHAPEAAARKHRDLRRPRRLRVIHRGWVDDHGCLRSEERPVPDSDAHDAGGEPRGRTK